MWEKSITDGLDGRADPTKDKARAPCGGMFLPVVLPLVSLSGKLLQRKKSKLAEEVNVSVNSK